MRWLVLALQLLLAVPTFAVPSSAQPPLAGDAHPRAAKDAAEEPTLEWGRFGTVHLYGHPATAREVVLFVSGDGGWELGVVDMARELAGLDALVVGIDITHYLAKLEAGPEKCAYPAADFEQLAQYVEKRLGLPHYVTPILVGYSSGATLVYALQVQAPAATFKGSMSLGFCPDLPVTKPFCKGQGLEYVKNPKAKGVLFQPATTLETPWFAFQGLIDRVCDPPATESYVARVPHGELVALPKVGHGFSVPRNWLPQFKAVYARLVADAAATAPGPATEGPADGETAADREPDSAGASPGPAAPALPRDLPLVEVPAQPAPEGSVAAATLAVILSGDGGWAGLDKEVAGELARLGIPTVGWNSLQYYWTRRSPDRAAADLERILRGYLAAWGRQRALLVGYSFGAEVLPFLAARLPDDLKARVDLVSMISPSRSAQFEFHVAEWLGSSAKDSLPIRPEVEKLRGLRVQCIQGEDDGESLCRDLPPDLARVEVLGGGHHFGGGYAEVARRILAAAGDGSAPPAAPAGH